MSDASLAELHAFAERLGVDGRLFEGDHYDVPAEYRDRAIELGAVPVDSRELVRRLRGADLLLSPTQRRQFPRQVATRHGIEPMVRPVGDEQSGPGEESSKEG